MKTRKIQIVNSLVPQPDWGQTDETKTDYIKNKPIDESGKILKENLDLYELKTECEELVINEYRGMAKDSTAEQWVELVGGLTPSYSVKGISSAYSLVCLPKCSVSLKVFDETLASSWSSPSTVYHMAKFDISNLVGHIIKVYGRSRSASSYPLAFCVDENYNVLGRYGTDTDTLYGYVSTTGLSVAKDAVEVVVPDTAKYIYVIGAFARITDSTELAYDAIPKVEVLSTGYVPNEKYKLMQSPLWGKKLYVDGDSICYGNGYKGGFGKIIADKYNMELTNAGVGGATIAINTINVVEYEKMDWVNNDSYYMQLGNYDPFANKNMEGFIVEITKAQYDNGFGEYPTAYKLINGELVEQPYSETMPTSTFFVKFDVPTYDGNTVTKYYRMWSNNSWLWEAYKSGFSAVHSAGDVKFGTPRHWLCKSVEDVDPKADYVVFEGGFNEYNMGRPIGKLTDDMIGVVDITTTIGATEHLCRQLLKGCVGKKILFVLVHKANKTPYEPLSYSIEGSTWTTYHDAILSVLNKYSIPVVDLFLTSAFNTEIEEYLPYTQWHSGYQKYDGVHPTKEGYELFYVPQIVNMMEFIS